MKRGGNLRKIRVKPSKGQSFLGLMIGIIFIVLGFTIVIPKAGLFGLLWTGFALMITIINGYNVFKLNKLKSGGVIIESEFQKQKEKIINRDM